jgi:hypothetical protein
MNLGETNPETIKNYANDELCQKRIEIYSEIGELSIQLSELSSRHRECIRVAILISEELRQRCVDTRDVESATTYRPLVEDSSGEESYPRLQAIA